MIEQHVMAFQQMLRLNKYSESDIKFLSAAFKTGLQIGLMERDLQEKDFDPFINDMMELLTSITRTKNILENEGKPIPNESPNQE